MRDYNAVGVLDKICSILDCLRMKPTGLTLTEIVKTTHLNKSTVHRLLTQMVLYGLLNRIDDGQFVIGSFLFHLAIQAPRPLELRTAAQPVMSELARETGETVNLAILEGTDIVIINVIESSHEFRMAAKVGSRRPFYVTSLGKSLVAFLGEKKCDLLIGGVQLPLLTSTPNSIKDLMQLRKELAMTRERGYSVDDEETVVGVRAVGAPVFAGSSDPEAALSISGPTSRIPTERIPALASLVRRAANQISGRLGGRTHDWQPSEPQIAGRKSISRFKS